MRQSGKEAKLERMMKQAQPAERREALALQSDAEFADEFGQDARGGRWNGRKHPPTGRA